MIRKNDSLRCPVDIFVKINSHSDNSQFTFGQFTIHIHNSHMDNSQFTYGQFTFGQFTIHIWTIHIRTIHIHIWTIHIRTHMDILGVTWHFCNLTYKIILIYHYNPYLILTSKIYLKHFKTISIKTSFRQCVTT